MRSAATSRNCSCLLVTIQSIGQYHTPVPNDQVTADLPPVTKISCNLQNGIRAVFQPLFEVSAGIGGIDTYWRGVFVSHLELPTELAKSLE